ncbi:hypothetical protein BKA70DRAFT_1448561 [Coprinopsis sp. MPI-PUGE-AT-0042]|nr:hypothetical protein BKA70DRAFT_1448561 [Coprinopsis sp. MPI-PUGE-AT-0042]
MPSIHVGCQMEGHFVRGNREGSGDILLEASILVLETVTMPGLIDFPHDILLLLFETVAKEAPTSLIPLASSSKLLWSLYNRPQTTLALTQEVVKGRLGAYFGTAKAIVIVEGFGFHLAEARRLEKELGESQNKDGVDKKAGGDQGSKRGEEEAPDSEPPESEDELIFRKHAL